MDTFDEDFALQDSDYGEYYEEDYDSYDENKQYGIDLSSYGDALLIYDSKVMKDRMAVVSFFITVYECFKSQVIFDVKSLLCLPDTAKYTFGNRQFIDTEKYKKEILKKVVWADKTGYDDPHRASMYWLLNEHAITKEDFENYEKMRKLRNRYAHHMQEYVLDYDKITYDNYELLSGLIDLLEKIDVWTTTHMENYQESDKVESFLANWLRGLASDLLLM